MRSISAIGIATLILGASMTGAFAQRGPVATACKADIPKFCADLKHGRGEIRNCLQSNYKEVSAGCKHALDTTGGGRRMNP